MKLKDILDITNACYIVLHNERDGQHYHSPWLSTISKTDVTILNNYSDREVISIDAIDADVLNLRIK